MQKISSTRHSYFETNVEQEPQSGNVQKVRLLVLKPCKFLQEMDLLSTISGVA